MKNLGYYIESIIYLVFEMLPVIAGFLRYKQLDKSFKIVFALCLFSFVGEVLGFYFAVRYHNNLLVYNIVELFTTTTICFYFNQEIKLFRKYNLGMYLAALSLLVWIGTNTFFIHLLNIPFLTYTGIMVIIMSIISIDSLLSEKRDSLFNLKFSPHFWFASFTTIYWCFSLIQWLSYHYLTKDPNTYKILDLSLTIVIMTMNTGYAGLFFFYPKMMKKNVA